MQLGSVRERAMPSHIQEAARDRVAGLRGPLSALRRAHLRSKVGRCRHPVPRPRCPSLFALAGIAPEDIDIVRIFSGPDWIFLRAVTDRAVLLRDVRLAPASSRLVPDPFC